MQQTTRCFSGPDDLGLTISPYLAGCNIDVEPPPLGDDPGGFDPKWERSHAKEFLAPSGKTYLFDQTLTGMGFTYRLSPERAAFWEGRLKLRHIWAKPDFQDEVWIAVQAGLGKLLETLHGKYADALYWLNARALLTDELREQLRSTVHMPTELLLPQAHRQQVNPAIYAPAILGGHEEELLALFENTWPQRSSLPEHSSLVAAVLLLPTVEARCAVLDRWDIPVEGNVAQALLVSLGARSFPYLIKAINDPEYLERIKATVEILGKTAHGPGMVPLMVELLDTRGAQPAAVWLREHPQAVAQADLSPAQVKSLLPIMRTWDDPEQLVATCPEVAAALGRIVEERSLPTLDPSVSWWMQAATDVEPYLAPIGLPPVLVDGTRLAAPELQLFLGALAATKDTPPALVTEVAQRTPTQLRDELAISLLEGWLADGAPAAQKWRMVSAGFLGGDRFVHTLAPLIREWPGSNQHQRAVAGLAALRNVGSDLALQTISAIAAKAKFAGIKKRAAEAMAEIAQARGLTRDQLEDRILPDGGLDARGRRIFDYGPRQFEARLTPDCKLVARLLGPDGHPTGKPKTTLPAPNHSDDPELAAAAKADFATCKKTLTTLAKTQAVRFERAMVQARRWEPQEFTQLITRHPVLRGVLAGVLWAVFDADQPTVLFRLDEGGAPVDADDEPVELTGPVGIIHPLWLTSDQQATWTQLFADYELRCAFQQLDRPVARLDPGQGDDTDLHGIPTHLIPAGKLLGTCTKFGWERGAAGDGGSTCVFVRPDEVANLTPVIVHTDGMWLGSLSDWSDQRLTRVFLLRGVVPGNQISYAEQWEFKSKDWHLVPWAQAPATLVSEVYLTLSALG